MKKIRTLVVLESPWAGDVTRHLEYARAALADSLKRGEAPIASHVLFCAGGVLNDTDPFHRELGMSAGHAWIVACQRMVVYADLGISRGMKAGMRVARRMRVPIETRYLGGEWAP